MQPVGYSKATVRHVVSALCFQPVPWYASQNYHIFSRALNHEEIRGVAIFLGAQLQAVECARCGAVTNQVSKPSDRLDVCPRDLTGVPDVQSGTMSSPPNARTHHGHH